MINKLNSLNVVILNNCNVIKIKQKDNGIISTINYNNEEQEIYANHVFNCTYSNLNFINYN